MKSDFFKIQNNIKAKFHDKKIGVAVSGGVDSMVLLTLVSKLNENITAINIDHMIRDENEKELVNSYCNKLSCKFMFLRIDVPNFMKNHKLGLEEAARLIRYEKLSQLEFDIILLAHHKDDLLETIFLNILRGTSYNGLTGMPQFKDKKFFRPFLEITKKQIEEFAKVENVPFKEDYTNNDLRFSRNYLRRVIIPKINERFSLNPLLRLCNIARRTEEYFEEILKQSLETIDVKNPELCVNILQQDFAIASRYCYLALKKIGVNNITYEKIKAILELANKQSGKKFCLKGFEIRREYDIIKIIQKCNIDSLKSMNFNSKILRVDADKLGEYEIRTRKKGDYFFPYGSTNKKTLKRYFMEKKIRISLRDKIILLCKKSEVMVIMGVEISDKVKVSENTINIIYF